MKRSAQRIVAAPKAATAGEAEEAGARLARNCGKPGFCASKNAPDVVQGKKSDEAISVETTFSELCSNPDKSLGAEPVESSTLEKLTEAKRNLPEQKTQELQKKVNAAVDNIIRNFSAVRMSTGMTPEEAVKLAAKTVGGKDSAVFVPPASGIVYQTPAMNAPFNARNGGDKRIFSDIRIADLIEKSKNLPPPTKEIEVERLIAESRQSATVKGQPSGESETETGNIHAEANRADKAYAETGKAKKAYESFPNLFSKEEREAWYKTESFRKTGLSVSDVENLVQSEEEKIQGLKPSTDKNVVTFSKKRELDRKLGYAAESTERSRNALLARIEPVTHSLNAEETAKRLEETENTRAAYTKEDDGLLKERNAVAGNLKVTEINANGRLSRELAAAVNAADFVDWRSRTASDAYREATPRNIRSSGEHDSVSAREQARSQILADALDAAAEFSMGIDGETPFYGENAVLKTERIEAARKPDFGNGNEETHSSVPAGETAFLPGTRSHAESVHSPAEHTGNRSTFSGNKSSYSAAADGARNNTFKESGTPHAAIASNESLAAYTVQPTDEDWNGAAETGASYTSVHSREDGSSAKKTGQNPSQPRGDISGQTKQMVTPEQEETARLERMNANYEHDKAVLAKADPMFARNQFWDVGHAEGSGEVTDRELAKLAQIKIEEKKNRLLDGGHFNEY